MHSIGLKNNTDGYCASGSNYTGQLGNNSSVDIHTFDCSIGTITSTPNNSFATTQFDIYPNPTTGEIYFSKPVDGMIEIFDQTGKLIIRRDLLSYQNELDIQSLPNGIYQILFFNKDSYSIKKIIKIK